jgi:hypothetical protein
VAQLLSKLIAGGLSAAVILLWWPSVFPSDTVSSWLIRGVIWTLSFELLLGALGPVEERIWRSSRVARRVREQAVAASARIAADSGRRRNGARSAVAGVALAVPLVLLATAPARPLEKTEPVQQVRHVTEVKRIVKIEKRRVSVPVPTTVASAAPVAAAPTRAAAPARRVTTPRASVRSTTPSNGTKSNTPPPRTADPVAATPQPSTGSGDQTAAPVGTTTP